MSPEGFWLIIRNSLNNKMLSVVSASAAAAACGGMGGMEHRLHHHQMHHQYPAPHAHHMQMQSAVSGAAVRRELAAQRDRQVRLHSVHQDLQLDLPPSIRLPDGEELPYGSSNRLQLRDAEQESEIYQKCIRAPPNRTVFESESPPPYRSSSAGLLGSLGSSSSTTSSDWSSIGNTPLVVRCHSLSSKQRPHEQSSSTLSHQCQQATSTTAAASGSTQASQKTDFLQRTVKIFTGKNKTQQQQQTQQQQPLPPVVIVPNLSNRTKRSSDQPNRSKPSI